VPAKHHPCGQEHIVDEPALHRNTGRRGHVRGVADRAPADLNQQSGTGRLIPQARLANGAHRQAQTLVGT
jgi:hypothetical protein